MEWCALIGRMYMDNHCRQHIGKDVYTVTACEVVATLTQYSAVECKNCSCQLHRWKGGSVKKECIVVLLLL